MAGYSGTPIQKKLGIKPGFSLLFVNAPANFHQLLGPLPDDCTLLTEAKTGINFVHLFCTTSIEIDNQLPALRDAIARDGMVWISWPKKSSNMKSEIDGNKVRELGLALGMVDIKVCAVDEDWSALKFVIRRKDR